jgi:hypothetical protein
MAAVLLHLSDIHVRRASDWILDKAEEIGACLFAYLPSASAVFVVVSGDIAWSGKKAEYDAAEVLFRNIEKVIKAERDLPVHFVVAPGNHDCDFSLDNKARQLVLQGIRNAPSEIDDSIIDTACAVQAPFRAFAEQLESSGETRVGDRLWVAHRFTVENKEIVFDALNVSWCSQLQEEPGSLVFPHARYAKYLDEHVDLRVNVIHHPLNWFSQGVYHEFKQLLRSLSNIALSGHEHVGGVGEDTGSSTGHSAYVEGCVLQDEKRPTTSSFNVVELNLDDGTYRSTRYLWDIPNDSYTSTEEGSWADFRSIPKKTQSRFPLTDSFRQLITDPGAAFQTAKGSAIKLADLYIYPDMQELLEKTEIKQILSTSLLQDFTRAENGMLLSGEEKVGASSLLYMLHSRFHDQGLLPVYVRGADIKGSTDKDFEHAVRKAVVEQYGEGLVQKFSQTSSAKKILLLDDLDDSPVRAAAYRAKLLLTAKAHFRYFVVTVSELFDFKASVAPHAEGGLADVREYRIMPFGYTLRAHLIRRWVHRTSDDGSLDEAKMLAKCDQAERLLDSVMSRNIVPSLPLYLLTLLQSIDTGASGGFEESGLGEYYDFLIKEGLKSAGVVKRDWGKVIEYCTHLAWVMHATEHKELSLEEMRVFNKRYSEEEVRVELDQRLRALVQARILSESGGYYRFRYHYIYYFLKGRYLSSRLDDLAILAHIKECCAHLYVRENANTVLFLAHHAFDNPVFLGCVLEAVNGPFKEVSPIEFRNNDTAEIGVFVRDLPALRYTGEQPEEVRKRVNEQRDEMDDSSDGLADCKQEDADRDFIPQMVALLKTVEILGQILKNQVASVGRARRIELLQMLMKGPLRAVRAYFATFMADREQAQRELMELIRQKKGDQNPEKMKKDTAQLLAQLMQMASFGFVAKAVTSISSDDLLEDIDAAAKAINTPAAKLIAVGVRLDSPRDLPRNEMRTLLVDVEKDFIAMRVLQMLTLRRLYMFRTTEQDKQWLDSQKVLGLKMQQAVDLRYRQKKKLPSTR